MEGRNLFKIVKDFLLSNMNKQLLVFLFFVLLSAVFWFILTLNGAYEKELKIADGVVIKVDKGYVFKDTSSTPVQK